MQQGTEMNISTHNPVLISEVLHYLAPARGKTYVDVTFGRGGYTRAILQAADCHVVALDCDAAARVDADTISKAYPDNFTFIHARFSTLATTLKEKSITHVDGIVADFGVSSPQLDEAERGFSFAKDGPLDMRMDQSSETNAADVVNTYDEDKLVHIFRTYGEEKRARSIANAIIRMRETAPINRTKELARLVAQVVRAKNMKIHPATRVFQAIRIEVNQELHEIQQVLAQSLDLLTNGGRVICVSFHSLEDRIVKQFFKENSAPRVKENKYKPLSPTDTHPLKLLAAKPITPGLCEIKANPRARSAKLRAAIRQRSGGGQ